MSDGLYAALSGALAHQSSLDTVANNLANASTDGYRAVRPVFQQALARAGEQSDIRFTAIRRTGIDTSAGAVRSTDRPLDIVLPEDAFLAVQTPQGERYTRAGSLTLGADGSLRTKSGAAVLSEAGAPINVDTKQPLKILSNGELRSGDESMGFLRVVKFADPSRMRYQAGNLLVAEEGAGAPEAARATLEVGKVEESNATPVRAMTDLMLASRLFEAMERAIGTFQDIDERLVTTVPR